jgi:xanthine dehydrogenase small subunit
VEALQNLEFLYRWFPIYEILISMKVRSSIVFYLNGQPQEVSGTQSLMTLSDFLRYEKSLTGTKVVCAEGDCGACTVLLASVHELEKNQLLFKSVNSCILPVLSLDGCHLVTVEGLKKENELHPVQKSMHENFGSQCGFCTPGFVCAMAALAEDSILKKKQITEKRAQNYLTGNLCRCTGYTPILKAATSIDLKQIETLRDRYSDSKQIQNLKKQIKLPAEISLQNFKVFLPTTLDQALKLKNKFADLKIVAGATDLGVAVNKGRMQYQNVMSLQNISSLWKIQKRRNKLVIPARVTLAQLQKEIRALIPQTKKEAGLKPNAEEACQSTEMSEQINGILNIFASPQIKNSGTLVGNVVNASPIADTIPFLLVNDAEIEVQSLKGTRLIPADEFYLGYKKLNLKPNEIVTAVHLPLFGSEHLSKLYKVSLRKDLDISAVTMAARFKLKNNKIQEARLAFGGVGPVVLRLKEVEKKWLGQDLNRNLLEGLSKEVSQWVTPISDVRGSKEYRLKLCQNLLLKMADECL